MLVPEIGLTPQTINRFRKRFNVPVEAVPLGSMILSAWMRGYLRDKVVGIVIGTRSALLTCLLHFGIIIVDEEHDSS